MIQSVACDVPIWFTMEAVSALPHRVVSLRALSVAKWTLRDWFRVGGATSVAIPKQRGKKDDRKFGTVERPNIRGISKCL